MQNVSVKPPQKRKVQCCWKPFSACEYADRTDILPAREPAVVIGAVALVFPHTHTQRQSRRQDHWLVVVKQHLRYYP